MAITVCTDDPAAPLTRETLAERQRTLAWEAAVTGEVIAEARAELDARLFVEAERQCRSIWEAKMIAEARAELGARLYLEAAAFDRSLLGIIRSRHRRPNA